MAGQCSIPKAMRPVQGTPPTIEWRAIGDLLIDGEYQRRIDTQDAQRLIRSIALDWDWRLCAPLTCARRDTGLYVIDGQHRLEAARARGDILHLPCIVSTFGSVGEEAKMFVAVNHQRRTMAPIDKFRAAIAAGDERAIEIKQLIEGAGLIIAPHSNSASWKPLYFGQIGGVRSALIKHGSKVVSDALTDLATAFPNESLRLAGRLMPGIYAIRGCPPAGFEADAFRLTLARVGQAGWVSLMLKRQAKFGELADTAISYAMTDALKERLAVAA